MKKGLKSCLIVVFVLVGLCIAGVAVMFFEHRAGLSCLHQPVPSGTDGMLHIVPMSFGRHR